MVSKSLSASLSLLVSTVALTGAVLAASIVPGTTCPFSEQSGTGNSFTSGDTAGPTQTSVNNAPDLTKLGIAGVAAFLGLFTGGMFLKSRLTRPGVEPELPQAEPALSETIPAYVPVYKVASSFPIEVPAEALTSHSEASSEKAPLR